MFLGLFHRAFTRMPEVSQNSETGKSYSVFVWKDERSINVDDQVRLNQLENQLPINRIVENQVGSPHLLKDVSRADDQSGARCVDRTVPRHSRRSQQSTATLGAERQL